MTSSIDARRQHVYDGRKHSISGERLDSASISGSPARLQSNQRSETPVPRDAQKQSTSEVEVKGMEWGEKEVEGQQQEEAAWEGEKQRQEEALRQVRKDLEDTTGFDSYEAYLESFRRDPMYVGRSYTEILDGCFPDPIDVGPGVDIIDVSNEDLSRVGVRLRCEDLSASEISKALCHPPPNTRVQIVLWPIDTYTRDIEDFLDVLGVGLLLDPCFFEALWCREDETQISHQFRSKNILCMRSIGTSVFVAHSFVLAQDNPVPVVLIAGPMHEVVKTFNYYPFHRKPLPNKAIYDLVRAAPLYSLYDYNGKPHFANTYIRALFALLKSDRDSVLSSSDTLSACIIPLFQIEIAICKGDLDNLRKLFHELKDSYLNAYGFTTRYRDRYDRHREGRLPGGETPEYLYCYRTKLRSWIVYLENQNGALTDLLSSLLGANVTKGLSYSRIKEESFSIAEEAGRLEAEIRDYLQLQGSRLALLESKKSIELSNNQIYEGKRVKIFTVLAFFYIPLNLATSVFGMNIQQLNHSGTSIGVFLATAGILLFITGVSWLFLEGVQDARVWLRRVVEDRSLVASQEPSIFVRFYLIWWLSRNGLFKWMVYTGAGSCLLINSYRGFRSQGGFAIESIENLRAIEVVLDIMPELPQWRILLNANISRGGWLTKLSKRRTKRTPSLINTL